MPNETAPPSEQSETSANRVSLRNITEDEVEAVLEWAKSQDPEYLKRAIPLPETENMYDSAENLLAVINNHRVVFQDVIVGGKRAGNILLVLETLESKEAEIGFIIDQNEQGKGYAKEAVAAIADFAFNEMRMESLTGRTKRYNKASADTLYAVGFNMVLPPEPGDDVLVFRRRKDQPVRGYKIGYLNRAI
jgi:ribosomal-protein-alanine N-acetyltransferase